MAEPNKPSKPEVEIILQWGVKIPLRDGVRLNATIYQPRQMPDPLPAVFTLTPYTADSYHERGDYFARHGYTFLLVDCRGRGNSEGEFLPFESEAQDGHDVVEWLAAQPWCDGQVTMWGGSYAVDDRQPVPAAPGDHRAGCLAFRRNRLPVLAQRHVPVRDALADADQRPDRQPGDLRRRCVLGGAVSAPVPQPPALRGSGEGCREHVNRV